MLEPFILALVRNDCGFWFTVCIQVVIYNFWERTITGRDTVLGSLLLKSNSLHITLYFVESLCITVTYYLEIKVTSNILN